MPTLPRLQLLFAGLLLLGTSGLDAQQARPGGGPGGQMGPLVDPIEVALEHHADLGLSSEVVAHLQAYHAASLERTKEAREVAAPMLERMRQMQDRPGGMQGQRGQGQRAQGQRGSGSGMQGQGQRGGGAGMNMDENVMHALQTLRGEYEESRKALLTHLDDEQTTRLRALMQRNRAGPGAR